MLLPMIGVLLGGLNAANSITCHIISGLGYLGFLDKHYFQLIGCYFQVNMNETETPCLCLNRSIDLNCQAQVQNPGRKI